MICRAKLTGRMGRQSGCYCAFSSSNILIHLYILNIQANFCSVAIYIHTYAIQLSFFCCKAHSTANQFRSKFNLLLANVCLTIFFFHTSLCIRGIAPNTRKESHANLVCCFIFGIPCPEIQS